MPLQHQKTIELRPMPEYIIVGQGLAGSMLSYFLWKKGKSFMVIDEGREITSSAIAAGMFNPVTGRRYNKTWLAEEVLPLAEETYLALEEILSVKLYHPKKILRIFPSEDEKKEALLRLSSGQINEYIINVFDGEGLPVNITAPLGAIEIKGGGNIDSGAFISAYRKWLKNNEFLTEEKFNWEEVVFENERINWRSNEPSKIIFCEGHYVQQNPLFGKLPFSPAKGEILTIKSPGFKCEYLINKGIYILPVKDDIYKVGTTYEWDELDEIPTEKAKEELIAKLTKILPVPFEVIGHQAAVRPATYDRRPIIGMHPEYKNVGILNGYGTKGVILAPYFGNQFADFLVEGKPFNKEADIARFKGKL